MRVSKFIKVHKDVLIEYIYDDGNNISEPYKILLNIRDNSLSYVAASASSTGNSQTNQLHLLDSVTGNYGLVNTTNYSFLQLRDYASGFPIRHDKIKVHIPVNYTFGENLGFYMKIIGFDFNNQNAYSFANFYFDITNIDQSSLLEYNSPPFLFQEKLWGKNITFEVPSLYAVARQRVGNSVRANSINANLSNNAGFSLTAPIFLEFSFLQQKRTVNRVTTYTVAPKIQVSLPQAPDFENLGVMIAHSKVGDFFEIYGTFNGDINQFDDFINGSVQLGNRYYVTYTITLFEQNIRGKTFTITVLDNFNEKIEYRPIIKYSTTTAIIDVEMNIIDAVDNTSIYRRASYGMLQDEVAKYSLFLMKINLANASKPKIYNIKSPEGAGIFGQTGQNRKLEEMKRNVVLEPVKINYTVLADKFNVVAKSDNVLVGSKNFYGIGKLEIILQPFDNIIQFKIAKDVTQTNPGTANNLVTKPEYMDMTNMGEIKFIIKDDKVTFETGLYFASNEVDLANGFVVFKIPSSRMNDIKKIADGGNRLFYVISRTDTGTTVVYSGLFKIFDTLQNINLLADKVNQAQDSFVVLPDSQIGGVANVTRRTVTNVIPAGAIKTSGSFTPTTNANQNNNNQSNQTNNTSSDSSSKSSLRMGLQVFEVNTDSSLSVNGYAFTSNNIKAVLNLPSAPINLTMKGDSLYANGGLLERLEPLAKKLELRYINTPELKTVYDQIQNDFKTTQLSVTTTSSKAGKLVGTSSVKLRENMDGTVKGGAKKAGKLGKN